MTESLQKTTDASVKKALRLLVKGRYVIRIPNPGQKAQTEAASKSGPARAERGKCNLALGHG